MAIGLKPAVLPGEIRFGKSFTAGVPIETIGLATALIVEKHPEKKSIPQKVVFLFDVDNTLLDNDGVTADLRKHLEAEIGREQAERYWAIFEQLRSELGYADYLGALQRYRIEYPRDLRVLTVSHFLVNYPFANRLYP